MVKAPRCVVNDVAAAPPRRRCNLPRTIRRVVASADRAAPPQASLLAKTLSPHDEAAPTHPHARSSPHAPPRSLLSRTLSAHEDAATEDASHARTVVGDDGDGLDMSISAKHRPRRQGSNQVNDTHLATKGSSGTKPFSLAGSLTSGGIRQCGNRTSC